MTSGRTRQAFSTSLSVLVLACAAAGCTSDSPEPMQSGGDSSVLPLTAGQPSEGELEPGWDESPDGAPPVPVEELSDTDLHGMLRTRASAAASAETCAADEVEADLFGLDVAAGHRYTSLRVRNVSERSCELNGRPGIGARGQWGNAFKLTVEAATDYSDHRGPTVLAPGQEAVADIEWTGMLAGAPEEKAAALIVQLAGGQVPFAVPAELHGGPIENEPLDLGMLTTLKVGRFIPYA